MLALLTALAGMISVLIGNSIATRAESRASEQLYVHTFDVLLVASKLETAVTLTIRGERGYLITGDRSFLNPYYRGRAEARHRLKQLYRRTRDNVVQQRNLATVEARLERYLAQTASLIALEGAGRHEDAVAQVRSGIARHQLNRLQDSIDRVEQEEGRLLVVRSAARAAAEGREGLYAYFLAGAAAVLLLLLALAIRASNRAHQRTTELASELNRLATIDALTGLYNRRQFLAELDSEVRRAMRTGRCFTLALLDIDRFKAINDTYGHPAGDEVLRETAKVLSSVARDTDIVARFGGEEFAVLMPETNIAQARLACERFRAAVAKREVSLPCGTIRGVTVSMGVAELIDEDAGQLISRADKALYAAKAGGRNLVRLAA